LLPISPRTTRSVGLTAVCPYPYNLGEPAPKDPSLRRRPPPGLALQAGARPPSLGRATVRVRPNRRRPPPRLAARTEFREPGRFPRERLPPSTPAPAAATRPKQANRL